MRGRIHEVIRSVSGYKAPANEPVWVENPFRNREQPGLKPYSQFGTYYPGDEVLCNNLVYTAAGSMAASSERFAFRASRGGAGSKLLHGSLRYMCYGTR